MCLVIASAPFDIAISSVIWNPPVAAALVKMATAMALGPRRRAATMEDRGHRRAGVVRGAGAPVGDLCRRADPRWHLSRRACRFEARVATRELEGWRRERRSGPRRGRRVVCPADSLLHRDRDAILPRRWDRPRDQQHGATSSAFRLDRSYGSVVNGAGDLLVRQFDSWRFQIPTLIAALVIVISMAPRPRAARLCRSAASCAQRSCLPRGRARTTATGF